MSKQASFKLKVKGPATLVQKVAQQTVNPKATPATVRKKIG